MRRVTGVIPNNEEVESETNVPSYGYEIPTLGMPGITTRDIVYTPQRGEAIGAYLSPAVGIISVNVGAGSPLPFKIVGDEPVLYVGTCGARLEIGAVDTNAVPIEWISFRASTGDTSDDTTEQHAAFEDIWNKVLGPNTIYASKPSFEAYIERINKPGYRSEPVVKGKGIPVWAIAAYVLDLDLSYEEVVSDWEGEISVDEVNAAMEYYRAHPEEIEEKRRWVSPR